LFPLKTKFTLQECDKLAELGFAIACGLKQTDCLKRDNMVFHVKISKGELYLIMCILGTDDTPVMQMWKQSNFLCLLQTLDNYNIR
jgi:hypothetical protein